MAAAPSHREESPSAAVLPESSGQGEPVVVDSGLPRKKPRKPDRRRALTRSAIVEAATRLFAERGVDATTVDDIAEAAELSVGTLYFHFGNKENVLLALVSAVLAGSENYLRSAERSDSALERLLDAGDVYFRFAIEQPVAFQIVSAGLPKLAADAPAHAVAATDEISARMRDFVAAVARDLQEAIDDGEIDRVPITEAVAFIWGAWNGVAGLARRGDEFAIDSELGERALALGRSVLLKGLGGVTPPSGSAIDA